MIAPARQVSYRILLQIAATGAHSDDLLRGPAVNALSAQDRNLVTTLVLGTLRWQLALDARIREHLSRPNAQLNTEAATALRMGAYQLLHLDRVPAHAVLNDSVELVKQSPDARAAGMVNAVLRRIQAAGCGRLESGKLADRWAHPGWMVERWVRHFGAAAAEAICRWDQEPAGTALRVLLNMELDGIETEPGVFLNCARRVVRGDVSHSDEVRAGHVRIQDEASQLIAEILASPISSSSGPERVLDTCAAPGGKTAVLAERLPQAHITAIDASRKRLDAMAKTAQAGRFGVQTEGRLQFQVADASSLQLAPEYNRILCDVPCSGTGTLARNPEIRLRLDAASLPRQQARQIAILRAALAGLAPGGRLVYSTCSLEPEENEDVVSAVLGKTSAARLIPVAGILDTLAAAQIVSREGRERLRLATAGDFLRTIPGLHPCDGFFAAVIERD